MSLARTPAAFAVALLFRHGRRLLLLEILLHIILLDLPSEDVPLEGPRCRPCESSAARDRLQQGAAPLASARAASAACLMALFLSLKPTTLAVTPHFLSPRSRFFRIACLNFVESCMPRLGELRFTTQSLAKLELKLHSLKWRSMFVFYNSDMDLRAYNLYRLFYKTYPFGVQANRCIKFQGISSTSYFSWCSKPTICTQFRSYLIDKHQQCPGARKRMAQLAKCLTHKPCLKCNMCISHLTIQFSFRNKGCYFLRTLSTTTTSIEPLRIRMSARPRACSPQSG